VSASRVWLEACVCAAPARSRAHSRAACQCSRASVSTQEEATRLGGPLFSDREPVRTLLLALQLAHLALALRAMSTVQAGPAARSFAPGSSAASSQPDFPSPPTRPAPSSSLADPLAAPAPPAPPRAHYFHYGQRSVKARIDPEVPLDEVLRQLCAAPQLAVTEPPALFALRERDSGTLVTKDNMRALLEQATTCVLALPPSPSPSSA